MEMGIVTGRIYTGSDTIAPFTKRQLQDMGNLGANTIRIEFEDGLTGNGTGNTARIAAYRSILQWADELGIKVIGVLGLNAMPETGRISPNETRDKADFDARFVPQYLRTYDLHEQTYGGYRSLEGYEIWNEPDVDYNRFRRGGVMMGDEIALLHVRLMESRVLGKPEPRRKILFSPLSRADEGNGLRAILDTETIRWYRAAHGDQLPCDIFAIHGYGSNENPASPQYAYDQCVNCPGVGGFEHTLDLMLDLRTRWDNNARLIPTAQIYLTEVGYNTRLVDDQQQAAGMRHVFETLRHPRFSRIAKAFWYDYRDDEVEGTPGEKACGLRRNPRRVNGQVVGGEIKRSWNAFRSLNNRAGVGQQAAFSPHPHQDRFFEAFNRFDTPENLAGQPDACPRRDIDTVRTGFVHAWGGAFVQFFSRGWYTRGDSAITYVAGDASAAVITAAMFDSWIARGGGPAIGFPFNNGGGCDTHDWQAGPYLARATDLKKPQTGEKSVLLRELAPVVNPNVFHVFGDIYRQFMDGGGLSRFGPARGEAVMGANNKRSQTFAGGATLTER